MASIKTKQAELLTPRPPAHVVVNGRCEIFSVGEERSVFVNGVPVWRYHRDDNLAERLFVAQALETGRAKPGELAAALGMSLRSVHRAREKYLADGVEGLVPKKRGPKGPRLGEAREQAIRIGHRDGLSVREMARRLGVSRGCVSAALDRLGLPRPKPAGCQVELPLPPADADACAAPARDAPPAEGENASLSDVAPTKHEGEVGDESELAAEPMAGQLVDEDQLGVPLADAAGPSNAERRQEGGHLSWQQPAAPVPVATTLDTDPANRVIDRMLAARGELLDAAPLFASRSNVPRAGALLAVPLLVGSGVFEAARKVYGDIGPAFYGLRTTLLILLLLALLRVKRPENIKEYSPAELGWVLGLDRAPEVKTLRRKLERLVSLGQSEVFLKELVQRRVQSRSESLGFLYVDGHVRVYTGKVELPKTHVARMRISLPAAQDLWVNDTDGAPLLFVTQEAHPSLVTALPKLLEEIRKLVGPDRRVTVVFDRGGWSPKLFQWMDERGFDVLTYRKGKQEPMPAEDFVEHVVPGTQGKRVYVLHDTDVSLLGGKFSMRQVTRLTGDHQTQILTTRRDLPPLQVALRMFNRWRQENFFKYMRHEFAIDALVEYGAVQADPARTVPNPARKDLDRKVAAAKREVKLLEAKYGAAAIDNPESRRRTMRGFKIAHGTAIGIPLRQARAHLDELLLQRRAVPDRVPIGQIKQQVLQLPREKKRLADGLKMLAYQVETDLARAVAPFYARSLDEGRTLVTSALQSSADLEVTEHELRVTLAPQSSPHRSRSIAQLCTLLNATHTPFPGTDLRLTYAVRGGECAK